MMSMRSDMLEHTPQPEAMVPMPVRKHPRTLSQVLRDLAEHRQGNVTVRCMRDALADRSFATFLVLTSAINMLPFPPGSTLVFGIPVVLVALQMIAGRKTVWLPEFFLRRSMGQERFQKMTRRLIPLLERLEGYVKPRRWPFSTHNNAERIIGLYALLLGMAIMLPVPFGNWLPALACAICGLALSERDGVWLAVGVVLGLTSIMVILGVVFAAGTFAMHWAGL